MPTCRECNSRITKFDKDRCPVCGCKNPIIEGLSETIEITSQINIGKEEFKNYKPKRRSVVFLLFFCLGFFGIPFFYLAKIKEGVITLIAELSFILGVGSILAFVTPLGPLYGYLITFGVALIVNLSIGLIYLFKGSLKDGHGEFII